MYKSDELETFPAQVEKIFNALSNDVMSDVIERIRENDEITRTGDWRLYRLHQMGANMDTIVADIQTALDLADEDMQRLYSDVLKEGYARNEQMYKAMNKPFIPYEKNEQLQQLIGAVKSQTGNEFRNITGTMGFTVKNVAGTSEFVPTNEYIQKVLDEAAMHVLNGTYDYNSMIKRVVDEMTKSGVRTIEYSSGYSTRIDVAARRAIVTGLNQVTSRISEDNMEKLDTQFVETSWHSTARPSHQEWQGRVFYWNKSNVNEEITIDGIHYKAFIKETGYGTVEGLCGANCYHTFYPFIPGVSVRNYTDEELDQMNAAENEVKEYNGKEYTKYEATQEQRRLERTLRKLRQDIDLMEKAGLTDEDEELVGKKCKYQTYMRRYKDFSNEMGLKEHWERITVDGQNEIIKRKEFGENEIDDNNNQEKTERRSSEFSVELDYIRSEQYKNRLFQIIDDPEIVDKIHTRIKWVLGNRDGLNSEELYAFDMSEGKDVAIINNQHLPYKVNRTIGFNEKLKEADEKGNNILLIHNHPKGLPPSIADINALYKNKNVVGITIGHDGSIYYYTRPNKEIKESDFSIAMRKYKMYSEITNMENALEELSKDYHFVVRLL